MGDGHQLLDSLSPATALRSATRVLPLALALTVVARVSWARGPSGALWPGQGCAALGRCSPGRDPTCVARGPPRCFCDQACGALRDCRADCARVRPGVSCVVAEWSGWGRCLKPCQISHRVRQRHVLREPRKGGAPCPPLEERASCVDDQRPQGAECQQSLIPALIATDSYGKERKKQGVPKEQETLGYCVRFQLGPIPGSCRQVRALHARWTRYLTRGHTVCVRCEWPAHDARSQCCYGDGGGAGGPGAGNASGTDVSEQQALSLHTSGFQTPPLALPSRVAPSKPSS